MYPPPMCALANLVADQIPALVIDGHTLIQSVAIIEYLEETRPTPALYPKDPYQRALVRQVIESISCDIQPVQNLRVLKYVGARRSAYLSVSNTENIVRRGEEGRMGQALDNKRVCGCVLSPSPALLRPVTLFSLLYLGVEKLLKTTAGKYSVGDEVTAADALLVPQVYNAGTL